MIEDRPTGIPEGFEQLPARGPFFDVNGPMWRRQATHSAPLSFGFLPEPRHTNSLGFVHGGMICAFLDSALAQTLVDRFHCRLVTRELNISFQNAIPKGRWAETIPEIGLRLDDDTITATADLIARKQICASAVGVFRLFPDK